MIKVYRQVSFCYFKDLIFFAEAECRLIFSYQFFWCKNKLNQGDIRSRYPHGNTPIFPYEGIISPIAFEAPVEVGTIDWLADRASLIL